MKDVEDVEDAEDVEDVDVRCPCQCPAAQGGQLWDFKQIVASSFQQATCFPKGWL